MTAREAEGRELVAPLLHGDLPRIDEIAREHRVLLLAVFGSTAKGRRRPHSDLDLAVLFQGPPEDETWLSEQSELEGALDRAFRPDCPVELVVLHRASEVLAHEVAKHGLPLYPDIPDRWILFRIQANRRYEDTAKYRRRQLEQLRRKYGVSTP